jgi:hypothetical protein
LLQQIFDYIKKEWSVLKGAPGAFVGLAVIFLISGIALASWHYSERFAVLESEGTTKDGEIHRYKVALGLEGASRGNLIELTNDELRVKSTNTANKLRQVCSSLRTKDEAASKAEAKFDIKTKGENRLARMREASDEIDRSVRSDTILIDNELRRRLSQKALGAC